MTGDPVVVSVDGPIAVITLNRPDRANAIDAAMLAGLQAVERRIAADDSIRAVVVTGAGRHFCAGIDLAEALQQSPWAPGVRIGFDLISQPVIAAVNGSAMGGGLEIALACDLRIVATTAQLGLPEVQFGELPLGGGTARLARLVGLSRAKQMILTGEPIDAATALAWGLADEVAPVDATLDTALALARRIAAHAPYAVRLGKLLVDRSLDVDIATALDLERRLVPAMATEAERREARRAAAERSPVYRRLLGSTDAD
jgi:enoyl-CoA hydratase/carnithine racemase